MSAQLIEQFLSEPLQRHFSVHGIPRYHHCRGHVSDSIAWAHQWPPPSSVLRAGTKDWSLLFHFLITVCAVH